LVQLLERREGRLSRAGLTLTGGADAASVSTTVIPSLKSLPTSLLADGYRADLHVFNITTGTWTELTGSMTGAIPTAPRAFHGFVTFGGKIYVFGGNNGQGTLLLYRCFGYPVFASQGPPHESFSMCKSCSARQHFSCDSAAVLCSLSLLVHMAL
jgi:hypothetical protein